MVQEGMSFMDRYTRFENKLIDWMTNDDDIEIFKKAGMVSVLFN